MGLGNNKNAEGRCRLLLGSAALFLSMNATLGWMLPVKSDILSENIARSRSGWPWNHQSERTISRQDRALHSRSSFTASSSTLLATSSASLRDQNSDSHVYKASVYEPIPLPSRALVDTHAVFGALLEHQNGGIRSFQVFRNTDENSNEVVKSVVELGYNLDGHRGVVHGGILALLIDDTLGFAVIEALLVPYAVTANLNINYRAGVPAGSTIVIRTKLVEWKERKLVWNVTVESNEESNDGSPNTVYCEATSVFVIPRHVYESINDTKQSA